MLVTAMTATLAAISSTASQPTALKAASTVNSALILLLPAMSASAGTATTQLSTALQ